MTQNHLPDILLLEEALDAIERDARSLVTGLTDQLGAWRAGANAWSVAECLDHLAATNVVYLEAMRPAAENALAQGRSRRRPARPGLIGRWFVRSLEPPVTPRFRAKAAAGIRPRTAPPLDDAVRRFLASQDDVRKFLQRFAEIDLAGVHFPNPFIKGLRFSLATGLHAIAAHERRHLWQAWRVRQAAAAAVGEASGRYL